MAIGRTLFRVQDVNPKGLRLKAVAWRELTAEERAAEQGEIREKSENVVLRGAIGQIKRDAERTDVKAGTLLEGIAKLCEDALKFVGDLPQDGPKKLKLSGRAMGKTAEIERIGGRDEHGGADKDGGPAS